MTQTASPRRALRATTPTIFRADIQALRAIAIGAVVVNHLWPEWLGGGFVGVDIFFVISGFLITGHLAREIEATGRVGLAPFYARRIRRLLPAAILVLIVTLIAVWVFLPPTRWPDNAIQATGSAAYVENWVLAALAVDYMASNSAASAVQHYWSLSVEEQFYLVWPLLLVGGALLLGRIAPRQSLVKKLAVVIGVVAVLSFALNIVYTASNPQQAYFVTFTRVWQFGVGAAVALLSSVVPPKKIAAAMVIVGYGGIAFSAFAFSPTTPYPGWAALVPTLATAFVIWAGSGARSPVPIIGGLESLRPVQWIGDISYSLYLWHWPMIVVVPFIIGDDLGSLDRLALLALALVAAWATRRLVEVPAQRARVWKAPWRAFVGMAAMVAVVCSMAWGIGQAGQARIDQIAHDKENTVTSEIMCTDGVAIGGAAECDPGTLVPNPVADPSDAYYALAAECGDYTATLALDDRHTTRECDFSGGSDDALNVWLVGDSHAEQWQAPIFELARESGWRVTISTFAGCPAASVPFVGFGNAWGPVDYERCRNWATGLSDTLLGTTPDIVFTSMAARQAVVDDGSGSSSNELMAEGLAATWSSWADAGITVVPIRDVPLNAQVRSADCLTFNSDAPTDCGVPIDQALPEDPIVQAATALGDRVTFVDLTNQFCDASACYAAVGGTPVYFDHDHVSRLFGMRLVEPLREQIASVSAP